MQKNPCGLGRDLSWPHREKCNRLHQNPQSTGAVSAKDDEPTTIINQPLIVCERPVMQECVLIERDKACEASVWLMN